MFQYDNVTNAIICSDVEKSKTKFNASFVVYILFWLVDLSQESEKDPRNSSRNKNSHASQVTNSYFSVCILVSNEKHSH